MGQAIRNGGATRVVAGQAGPARERPPQEGHALPGRHIQSGTRNLQFSIFNFQSPCLELCCLGSCY